MVTGLRIASIPERHVYVRHLMPEDATPWTLLPDPPGRPWWPPARLDAAWVDAHADDFDVFHVHFGFDAVDPASIAKVCAALRRRGRPLVYTVHDLRNPHHDDPAPHRRQMAVWLAHADAVLTLTHGAAAELREQHGVAPVVVPHPHVVPLDEIRERRSRRLPRAQVPRVGLHLKPLRPNMAALPALRTLPDIVAATGCDMVVDVHRDVVDPAGANYDAAVVSTLEDLRRAGHVAVSVHDFFDGDAFLDYLASLDVSVLPYRYGTHSGWLEACRDLGVAVVASDCGHYAEQGASATFTCNEVDGLRPSTLIDAVAAAIADPAPPPTVAQRRAGRAAIAEVHRSLYATLAGRGALAGAS